jgi:hypothetical protein
MVGLVDHSGGCGGVDTECGTQLETIHDATSPTVHRGEGVRFAATGAHTDPIMYANLCPVEFDGELGEVAILKKS